MKFTKLSLLALAAVLALPVFAQSVVEDAIRLSQGGVGEEVMIAWAEKQNTGGLAAQDIIHLKEAKVPDRAIAALIRGGTVSMPAQYAAQTDRHVTEVPGTSTTYVQPSTSYTYSDDYTYPASYSSYPYYYSSYPYYYSSYYPYYGYPYRSYYYGGYPYYRGYYGSGLSLSFNFGGGHRYGGGYYGGYRGGYSGGY